MTEMLNVQWTTVDNCAAEVMEELAMTESNAFMRLMGWCREAVIEIGLFPEFALRGEIIEIDECGRVEKPWDYISCRTLFVCNEDGRKQEAVYAGKAPTKILQDGCCSFYSRTLRPPNPYAPGLFEDTMTFFFPTLDAAAQWDTVLLEYNALLTDDNGSVMVPVYEKEAVKAWAYHKELRRQRNIDRDKVPQSDVDAAESRWERLAGVARGKMKTPPKPAMDTAIWRNRQTLLPRMRRLYG